MPFLNLQRILDENQDQAEQMGQKVVDANEGQLQAAGAGIGRVSANPLGTAGTEGVGNQVAQAQQKLAMAGSMGGRAAYLGPGATGLDSFLAGQSGAVQGQQRRYGNLMGKLQTAQGDAAQRTAAMERQRAANDEWQRSSEQAYLNTYGNESDVSDADLTAAYNKWMDAQKSGNTQAAASARSYYESLYSRRRRVRDRKSDVDRANQQAAYKQSVTGGPKQQQTPPPTDGYSPMR